MIEKSDHELVEEALRGRAEGFTALCERYYPSLAVLARAVLGDEHLAEDAAQEALAKACRRLEQLRNPDYFGRWVATICRNTARDMLRQQQPEQLYEDLSGVAEEREEPVRVDVVREAIDTLPAAQRELLFLRYTEGLSYERISAVQGMSRQAINGRIRRAKKALAKYLRRHGSIEVPR